MNKKSKLGQVKLGFSLIELSVVILVIGVLVLGVTQGSRIISESKLKSARALTNSSPVNSNSNLVLWLETTSDKSFSNSVANGSLVANWNDINPQASNKNNGSQANASLQPTYYKSRINNLPALNFESDYIGFDGTPIVGTDYTIFVVEQRRSSASALYFIGGSVGGVNNSNLHLGYSDNTTIAFRQGGNDVNISNAVTGYATPITRIHTFSFNSGLGKSYSLNGTSFVASDGATQGLVAFSGASIGGRPSNENYYIGDIGEVIIFNRYLTNREKVDIEKYLGQKWGIKIS
jgi:prepilin-type N-terminal cleavage/methylation domain-containing protein